MIHALAPLIILILFFVFNQKSLIETSIIENNFLLSQLIIDGQEKNFQNTKQLLATLGELAVVKNHEVLNCNSVFKGILSTNPLYVNLSVVDANGDLWCTAVPFDGPINVSDRHYFKSAVESKTFSLGEYSIGRIVHIPALHMAYPLLNENGEVKEVMIASLSLEWFNSMLKYTSLGEGSVVGIIDSNGIILAQYPDSSKTGVAFGNQEVLENYLGNKTSHTFTTTDLDAITRVYTFSNFSDSTENNIYIFIGRPRASIYEFPNRVTRNGLIFTALTLVLTTLIFIFDWKFFIKRMFFSENSDF